MRDRFTTKRTSDCIFNYYTTKSVLLERLPRELDSRSRKRTPFGSALVNNFAIIIEKGHIGGHHILFKSLVNIEYYSDFLGVMKLTYMQSPEHSKKDECRSMREYGSTWTISMNQDLKFDFYLDQRDLPIPSKIINSNSHSECSKLVDLIENRSTILLSRFDGDVLLDEVCRLGALGVNTADSPYVNAAKFKVGDRPTTYRGVDNLLFHPAMEEKNIRLKIEDYGKTWAGFIL